MEVAAWRNMLEQTLRNEGIVGVQALIDEWRHARLPYRVRAEVLRAYADFVLIPDAARHNEGIGVLLDCCEWTEGDPEAQAPVVVSMLYLCTALGDWPRAAEYSEKAHELLLASEAQAWHGRIYLRLANIELSRGNYRRARELALIANGYHMVTGYGPYTNIDRLAMLTMGFVTLVNIATANREFDLVSGLAAEVDRLGCAESGAAGYWHVTMANWALDVCRWDLVDKHLKAASAHILSTENVSLALDVHEIRIRATHAMGETGEALRLLGGAEAASQHVGDVARLQRLRTSLKLGV